MRNGFDAWDLSSDDQDSQCSFVSSRVESLEGLLVMGGGDSGQPSPRMGSHGVGDGCRAKDTSGWISTVKEVSIRARSSILSAPSIVLQSDPASSESLSLPLLDQGGFLLDVDDLNPSVQPSIGGEEPAVEDLYEVPSTPVEHLQNQWLPQKIVECGKIVGSLLKLVGGMGQSCVFCSRKRISK